MKNELEMKIKLDNSTGSFHSWHLLRASMTFLALIIHFSRPLPIMPLDTKAKNKKDVVRSTKIRLSEKHENSSLVGYFSLGGGLA